MRVIYATLLNRLALPDEENLTGAWIIPDISQHTIEGPMSRGCHGRSGLAQRATWQLFRRRCVPIASCPRGYVHCHGSMEGMRRNERSNACFYWVGTARTGS